MKTVIVFSVLMLPAILWGQIINHFDNLDSKWNVAKTYPAANQQNPNFVATTTTVYGFQADTVINSVQWFKVYSSNDSLFQNNLVYRGLLRTENNKVFYLDTLNQLDTLYDFNLNLGDSVLYHLYGMFPEWLEIINVDSIQISGEYYKRLKFAEPTMNAFDELNEIWIEGIGSIHGPLFPNFPVKFSQEMPDSMLVTCSYSDHQQVWQHPSYAGCYVNIVLGVSKLEIFDFKIYPNPFSDKIYFENSRIYNYDLAVLNSVGQVVRQIQPDSNSQSIDLTELKAGIYFLRISAQGITKTMKIIKKH
ncbi:MAG: T9SS type A sorting domain-containing protein [Lentimicrobium sp.]|jgi:hypothetical protein|nr:T9SS type A sorting domain-containing protein [Lentimicrobium sp.]